MIKVLGYGYTLLAIFSRSYANLMSRLLIAHLRARGALIGKNFQIRKKSTISIAKGGTLTIGDDVVVDQMTDIIVLANAKIVIGNRTYIGKRNIISAGEKIEIGSDVMIAHHVSINDTHHGFSRKDVPMRGQDPVFEPISIGNDVWIATCVTVVPGASVANRSIVAAHAVVTHRFEENSMLGGVPAKLIKKF